MEGWNNAHSIEERVEELLRSFSGIWWLKGPEMWALTTWRIGGKALALVEARSEEELTTVLDHCDRLEIPWRVLGRGSNILVSDRGFRGIVVRLGGRLAECSLLSGGQVEAGGGVILGHLVQFAMEQWSWGL